KLGIPVHIYLPYDADPMKLKFLREWDAGITYFDEIETARQKALEASQNQRMTFISAYNNLNMVLGGGTVAVEILDQLPEADMVLVPVGGGGLASGVGSYLKQIKPEIQVVAVQTENSPTFFEWFKARKAISVNLKPSIATGLSGYIEPETLTLPLFLDVVDQVVMVSETAMIRAMEWVLTTHKMVVEPSGIAAVAALLSGKLDTANKTVVSILTGSNISSARLTALIRPVEC
ncbi:MAG TPA: pyridoxal-phosphate dependent enzyme, partial [Sphingobacteriaceae bacterium]